jgi:uncharacterized SAM-binding protein YcdF (DUF218 family)
MRRAARVLGGSILLVSAALLWALANVGSWLVVADPLEHAQAIVVLAGSVPFRAIEAASLYRSGWAPEVWITRSDPGARGAALRRLGIEETAEEAYNREVLQRLGVPQGAIRLLHGTVRNTADEIGVIGMELRHRGGQRVIVVASKPQTRRARAIWHSLIGDRPSIIVRYPLDEPFDAKRWWRNTRDALAVARESLGLVNVWTGFPVRPPRPMKTLLE